MHEQKRWTTWETDKKDVDMKYLRRKSHDHGFRTTLVHVNVPDIDTRRFLKTYNHVQRFEKI
jgi:hypothetical protein